MPTLEVFAVSEMQATIRTKAKPSPCVSHSDMAIDCCLTWELDQYSFRAAHLVLSYRTASMDEVTVMDRLDCNWNPVCTLEQIADHFLDHIVQCRISVTGVENVLLHSLYPMENTHTEAETTILALGLHPT